jgi:DNA repair exonuclease SbcCD ATPase subunit
MKALGPKILKVSLSFWNVAIALENRIVGIISHVAELQERIPVPSMCLKTKKRKCGKRKLELD